MFSWLSGWTRLETMFSRAMAVPSTLEVLSKLTLLQKMRNACLLTVGSSMSGTFLPFQQIWGGVTNKVQPSGQALRMVDAIERGFDFTFVKSAKKGSHYSTLKTMKEVSTDLIYLHNLTDTNLAVD